MNKSKHSDTPDSNKSQAQPASSLKPESKPDNKSAKAPEYGGPKGLEPTRYGDWEKQGRCIDF